MKRLLFLFFVTLCIVQLVNAGETRNIEYTLNVSFSPYCVNQICNNRTISDFDNSTNITTNYTIQECSANCYGKIIVNGIDNNQIFFEIDTGDAKWKNGTSELRYGYKSADLGNLSDISGIRQELQNLTSCFENHRVCSSNLTECSIQKSTLDVTVSEKNNALSTSQDEVKKKSNERWIFLIGGIVLGIIGIKFIVPSIQGRRNPRDPSTTQFPSNAGYR